jgi:hypothetical protein
VGQLRMKREFKEWAISRYNLTSSGRRKGHAKAKETLGGWPSFIKNDEEREADIKKRLNGRRYDEPGMEVKFKQKR